MEELIEALTSIRAEDIMQLYKMQQRYDGTIIGDTIKLQLESLAIIRSIYGEKERKNL